MILVRIRNTDNSLLGTVSSNMMMTSGSRDDGGTVQDGRLSGSPETYSKVSGSQSSCKNVRAVIVGGP